MAKIRCAFEGSRFDSAEFVTVGHFLVHIKRESATLEPVDPPHEAMEGRRLKKRNGGYVLEREIVVPREYLKRR